MRKTKTIVFGAIGVIALATAAWLLKPKNDKGTETESGIGLLKTDANPLLTYTIDPGFDTTLVLENGSILKIPAGSFTDSSGKEVTGKVNVKYREFHTIGEILLSGIPMRYDTAGKESYFESAGMFELRGEQNGKELTIAKDKSIELALVSLNDNDKKFNQYFLDDKTGSWTYLGKDVPKKYKHSKSDSLSDAGFDPFSSRSKTIGEVMPIKPKKEDKKRIQFVLEVNKSEYPELAAFENIKFETKEMCEAMKLNSKMTWDEVELERIGNTEQYKVVFASAEKGNDLSCEVIAYPVLNEKDYAVSKKEYDALFDAYKAKSKAMKAQEKNNEDKVARKMAIYQESIDRYKKLVQENQQAQMGVFATDGAIYRTFQVKKFGIWNSDCPSNLPKGVEVMAAFQDRSGAEVKVSKLYLVDKSKNALYSILDTRSLSFDPSADNLLIVVTTSNKLGYVKSDVVNAAQNTKKKHTFSMEVMDKENYSPSDINALL